MVITLAVNQRHTKASNDIRADCSFVCLVLMIKQAKAVGLVLLVISGALLVEGLKINNCVVNVVDASLVIRTGRLEQTGRSPKILLRQRCLAG